MILTLALVQMACSLALAYHAFMNTVAPSWLAFVWVAMFLLHAGIVIGEELKVKRFGK